jgi:hypothetical protein
MCFICEFSKSDWILLCQLITYNNELNFFCVLLLSFIFSGLFWYKAERPKKEYQSTPNKGICRDAIVQENWLDFLLEYREKVEDVETAGCVCGSWDGIRFRWQRRVFAFQMGWFALTLKVGYSFAHEAAKNEIPQQLADERERHAEDAK